MAFRKRRNDDSDIDSDDDDKLPVTSVDDDEEMDGPTSAKKARNMWSDMLLEEQLLEKGQGIQLERKNRKLPTSSRGPESYVMPDEVLEGKDRKKHNGKGNGEEKPVFVVTPPDDDPFGDAPVAPNEEFGVKKDVNKPVVEFNDDGWWSKKGHAQKHANRGAGDERPVKKEYVPKQVSQLITEEYSLEKMLATSFQDDAPLEDLGVDIAKAMGEKDPTTIKKIVTAVGAQISIKLFNETKEIEKSGGMKTADGTRRRTPGGVYITLFKMDSDVSKETKDSIFGVMKQFEKERVRNRKRAHNFARKLDDVKKTMEMASKEEEKLAEEELGVRDVKPEMMVFDEPEVVDMV